MGARFYFASANFMKIFSGSDIALYQAVRGGLPFARTS